MSWLKKLLKYGLLLAIAGAIAVFAAYRYIEPDLPDIEALREVRLQVPLRVYSCLLYTSPSPRDPTASRMPSSA